MAPRLVAQEAPCGGQPGEGGQSLGSLWVARACPRCPRLPVPSRCRERRGVQYGGGRDPPGSPPAAPAHPCGSFSSTTPGTALEHGTQPLPAPRAAPRAAGAPSPKVCACVLGRGKEPSCQGSEGLSWANIQLPLLSSLTTVCVPGVSLGSACL